MESRKKSKGNKKSEKGREEAKKGPELVGLGGGSHTSVRDIRQVYLLPPGTHKKIPFRP